MFSFNLNIEILLTNTLVGRELLMNLIKELITIILHCIYWCAKSHLIQSVFLLKLCIPFLYILCMILEVHRRLDFFVLVWVPDPTPGKKQLGRLPVPLLPSENRSFNLYYPPLDFLLRLRNCSRFLHLTGIYPFVILSSASGETTSIC